MGSGHEARYGAVPGAVPAWALTRDGAVFGAAIAAALYFVGAASAFLIGTLSDRIFAPFWPPNTVLFCVFLFTAWQRWWIYLLAIFPVHAAVEYGVGMSTPQMLVAFATNVLVAVISAIGVRKFLREPPWLGNVRKASIFIAITALFSPALVAFAGAFVEILGGGPLRNYGTYWLHWYASNAMGAVTLGAIVASWHGNARPPADLASRRILEMVLGSAALVLCSAVAIQFAVQNLSSGLLPAALYAPLPIVLWMVVRFGAKGASIATLLIALVVIIRSTSNPSLFLGASPEPNVEALQLFIVALAIPNLLLGASIDQTRDVEQSIREREEQITFAATNANIGFWHFDRSTQRLWLSGHCFTMLGLKPMNAPPSREALINVVHPDDRDRFEREALTSGRNVASRLTEFRCIMPNQDIKWLLARSHSVPNEDGSGVRISGFFTDISMQKAWEIEAELQRKEVTHLMRIATLGELSGAIAHELNQPLTAILANAHAADILLRSNPTRLDDIHAILKDIALDDARASEVIERLRRLMKKADSKHELVDLNAVVQTTLDLLHSEMILRQFKVTTELSDSLPTILADPIQLQQVLLNLIMNAAEAMSTVEPKRRNVTVSSRTTGSDVELIVADQGPGLPPVTEKRLFEPFFTTKENGLGLGLHICARIATSHGGELTMANGLAGGAAATLRLPLPPSWKGARHEYNESNRIRG